jgi:uncharacterized protein
MSVSAVDSDVSPTTLRPITLITGGSRGIGLAMAERFAAAGEDLLLVARGQDGLDAARQQLNSRYRVRVLTLVGDVTDAGSPQLIADFVASRGHYVDTLVNNAGRWSYEPFASLSTLEIAGLVGTNMTSGVSLIHRFLPAMTARKRGRILNVGSLAGRFPAAGCSLYSGTKTFFETITLALQRETAGTGVSISLLLPGLVDTNFTQDIVLERASRPGLFFRLAAIEPSAVAEAAYLGLMSGQRVIVPGLSAQLLYLTQALVPAPLAAMLFYKFSGLIFASGKPSTNPVPAGRAELVASA